MARTGAAAGVLAAVVLTAAGGLAQQPAAPGASPAAPPQAAPADPPPRYPTVEVGGVLQLDTGWFAQSARNRAAVGDADDGTAFRTARLNARGALVPGTNYMLELDFGALASATPGRPNFQNAYLEVENLPAVGTARVGRWKQPFSLETVTSIRFLTFIERASPFAFVPFRRTGAGVFDASADGRWTYAASVFRASDDGFGGAVGDAEGLATAARVTHLLVDRDDGARLVHVGFAHTWNDAPNQVVRFGRFPEFGPSATPVGGPARATPNFFDTGRLAAHDYHVFGGEVAGVFGPASVQAEGLLTSVDRVGAPTAVFPSWYVFASLFLTGERRAYDRRAGAFGRVTPRRNFVSTRGGIEGPGAWEVAARVSQADVNDAGVNGGRLTDFTVGLNWHLNPNAKLQFNYIHALRADPVRGSDTASIFAARASLDF